MSIYVVKHRNFYHLFKLDDIYHRTFIKFWEKNREADTIVIDDTLKKGIFKMKVKPYTEKMPFYIAESYARETCSYKEYPLWWYFDTSDMSYKIIPQD